MDPWNSSGYGFDDGSSPGFLDQVGGIFTTGLEKYASAYVDGRFKTSDPAVQYQRTPDGRVVNNSTQQPVGGPAPMNYMPLFIGGAIVVVVLLLVNK